MPENKRNGTPPLNGQKYDYAVFDLDGTLVDTLPDIARIFNLVLGEEGMSVHSTERIADFIGWGLNRALELALPEGAGAGQLNAVREKIIALYAKEPARLSRIYPGIPEVLDSFKSWGIPVIIFTNKTEVVAVRLIAELFPGFEFEALLGVGPDFPPKPDPSALQHCLGDKLDGASILFAGDSLVDAETAGRLNADYAAAAWGYADRADLEPKAGTLTFDTPADMHRWLKKPRQ